MVRALVKNVAGVMAAVINAGRTTASSVEVESLETTIVLLRVNSCQPSGTPMWKPSYGSDVNGVVQLAAADEGAAEAVAVAGDAAEQLCANRRRTASANARGASGRLGTDEA
jgi:hypothetical protein